MGAALASEGTLPAGPLLFLSPHLDDAVFACGRLLAMVAGAVVATVLAGRPPRGQPLTDWDRAAGFVSGDDVVGLRRQEDRAALSVLGAEPCWLELRDSQYGGAEPAQVAAAVGRLLEDFQPDAVFFPLGLFHSDHRLVHSAVLSWLGRSPPRFWFAYEDALYRRLSDWRGDAIDRLEREGFAPRPVRFPASPEAADRKALAVACYASQLLALATPGRPGVADLVQAETYWRLEEP